VANLRAPVATLIEMMEKILSVGIAAGSPLPDAVDASPPADTAQIADATGINRRERHYGRHDGTEDFSAARLVNTALSLRERADRFRSSPDPFLDVTAGLGGDFRSQPPQNASSG